MAPAVSHILVMAKAPEPGRVKTRLMPPCSAGQAAMVAEAALATTLAAVAGSRAERRIVALAGRPGAWLPPGFDVVAQRGAGLAERLANAWADAGGEGVQIGMDTPQVTAADLDRALDTLALPAIDAVLGLALDGGWWAIGLRRPCHPIDVFAGVPMSTPSTGAAQLARLRRLGLRVRLIAMRRDVDRWDDATAVAAAVPGTAFAAAVRAVEAAAPVGV
ncbi:MAG: TIGR04282 family arsenosugar biosynthesis glycosyltransferase, partial [Acidimicrobiales bacterium]